MKDTISNAEFPMSADGRVYHLGVKAGDVAPRIVQAGDSSRIRRFSSFLDALPVPFESTSSRGFLVITGCYKGVPVSLISSGMGAPMMDFFVREVRAVVEGEIAIVRFGSCGSLESTFKVGALGVPQQAMSITTNYDHWVEDSTTGNSEPYHFSIPSPAEVSLHAHLLETLKASPALATTDIRDVKLHASADTFYGTQGRVDPSFDDQNTQQIATLLNRFPAVMSLEMETAHLFHLAKIHRPTATRGPISVAAVHMNFAARVGGESTFIDPAVLETLEPLVGRACLDAIIGFPIAAVKHVNGNGL